MDGDNRLVQDDLDEDVVTLSSSDEEGDKVTVSEVLIELDDNLKSKLAVDLMQICEVENNVAFDTLVKYKWNMQDAIDFLLSASNYSGDENRENMEVESDDEIYKPKTSSSPGESASTSTFSNPGSSFEGIRDVCSPLSDAKKEKDVELEGSSSTGSYSTWAPEKFSIMSWNLDGLDDKNLEKRTDAVIKLIEKEKHDVIFFQELLPYTFEYIAKKLITLYKPIPGTENPQCGYLTATFLKKNSVYYEDHFVIPYQNSSMERTLLVTKAFIGRAKLALLNTHLESTAEYAFQRVEQLKTCFEMASTFDSNYNVIFGGDLNLRDKEVGSLVPPSMCDIWVQCGSRNTCKYTWDLTRNTNKQMPSKFQPRCRFDRFYFRNSDPTSLAPEFFGVTGIEKVAGTQSFPSDHWAIISFFALSKEARKPAPRKRRSNSEIDGHPDE